MTINLTRRRLLALAPAALALSGCSSVAVFDTLVPHDPGPRSRTRDVAYGSDTRQKLDIYMPADIRRGMPVVIFYYGGSWNSGSKDAYSFVGDALAARGVIAVLPDYRLVPQVRFPTFLEDCAAAAAWVQNHIASFGGDPHRIVLAGHSAGAYNAGMLALDTPYLGAAGFQRANLKGFVGLAGPYDFLPLQGADVVAALGSARDPRQTQPITFAGRITPPTFLAAGDQDTTVLPRNTIHLAARLRRSGVRVVSKIYPGVTHAGLVIDIAKPFRDRAPVLDDVTAFLQTV